MFKLGIVGGPFGMRLGVDFFSCVLKQGMVWSLAAVRAGFTQKISAEIRL